MSNTWGNLTWGFNQWNDLSNVSLSVTGISISTDLASVTTTEELNTGWGSDTWGTETWGQSGQAINLTGISLTATLDSVTTRSDVDDFTVTGEEMTSVVGNVIGSSVVDVDLTGQPMTATLQYQEAIVDPTGQELTANDGTADSDANTIAEVSATSASSWGYKSAWGFGVYGNEPITTLAMAMQEGNVDPAPDVALTGQAMAMVQGEETVTGDANVDVLNPSEGGNGFSVNGDAQLSTAEKQFGTASLLVDGTGDYVNASGTVDGLDGGAFTIEFWWYASDATTQTGILWDGRNASGDGYSIGINNGNLILYEDGAQLSSSSGLFSNNTWMHLAFARDASNNGALWSRGTRRNAIGGGLVNNNNSDRTFIGADLNGANAVSAYIDEYRQSDIARYNPVTQATITVPTSEFSTDANTVNLLHFDGTNGSTIILNDISASIAMTMNDGTADLDANTIVEVTATSAVTWGNSAWGYGVYGNQQVDTLVMGMQEGDVDPAPDANITGIEMTATLDDVVTQGDANTGTITDIEWGEQTWGQSTWGNGQYFDATGYAQAATINLGTAVLDANTIAEVSGQEMTIQENDVDEVTGNANVLVSGNALTMAQGSLRTLIWNEVNTGTAPVVPPGWQEVDTAA